MSDPRGATNPIFSDRNKLKLGMFGANGPGVAFTKVPELFKPSWANSAAATRAADAMGMEAIVPYARWKAFNRHDHGQSMETSSWAAAASAITQQGCVMSTTHVPAYAPVIAAKTASTIDQISGGRFGMNIVCGWFKAEIEMFGKLESAAEDRYAVADEWITIQKRLWVEEEPFDFDGRFYQIKNAMIEPRTIQPGGPALMNAGFSPRGQLFAARHADIAFTTLLWDELTPDAVKARVNAYKKLAYDTFGRDIQVWVHSFVVQRDSYKQAKDYVDYYVLEQGDVVMADRFLDNTPNIEQLDGQMRAKLRYEMMAGSGGFPLLGPAEEIAATLQMLSECGIDGTLLTWLDYNAGLAEFQETVAPLLVQAGLRAGGLSSGGGAC